MQPLGHYLAHRAVKSMLASDDALEGVDEDPAATDEDPELYLDRVFHGLQTLHAKVNLKLAKMQRKKEWIFSEPRPAGEKTRRNVRGIIATYVDITAREVDEGFDPEALDEAAKEAWAHTMIHRYGQEKMALMAAVAEHLGDEASELYDLTDEALTSPHVPYLRQVLAIPAYETRQVYFEQLRKAFLSVFVHAEDEAHV